MSTLLPLIILFMKFANLCGIDKLIRQKNSQRNRVDRFVLPRDYIYEIRRRTWHVGDHSNPMDFNFSIEKNLNQKKYASRLCEALGLEQRSKCNANREPLWPCIPRKKTFLSSADSILDLPTYSFATFPQLLDWGKDNVLVAALGTKYHKWSWNSQSRVSEGSTRFPVQCCKFDPHGELLLLGTHIGTAEIHENSWNKIEYKARCSGLVDHFCSVTTVDWSPTGNSFIMGCTWGAVTSFTRSADLINSCRVDRGAILHVQVSPDARFVAASGFSSGTVVLLQWPSLKILSRLERDWTVKALTWHPWRSALLGLGAVTANLQAADIAVWHAPTGELLECALAQQPYSLDTMLFSEKTGELVVSLWNTEEEVHPQVNSQLIVLSDPVTAVDQWGEGRDWHDRVRTMVFNPDGTKLATATSGEDLIIWNFLPEDKKNQKKKNKRFSALPVYLDEAGLGFSIR